MRPTVLLVDDDAAVRGALEFSLGLDGFSVESFADGEALAARTTFPERACLVLDQRLPGVSGLDLLEALRRRDVRLPALLLATHPNRHLRARASAAGVSLLEKPLLGESLSDSVRALTGTKRTT